MPDGGPAWSGDRTMEIATQGKSDRIKPDQTSLPIFGEEGPLISPPLQHCGMPPRWTEFGGGVSPRSGAWRILGADPTLGERITTPWGQFTRPGRVFVLSAVLVWLPGCAFVWLTNAVPCRNGFICPARNFGKRLKCEGSCLHAVLSGSSVASVLPNGTTTRGCGRSTQARVRLSDGACSDKITP